MATQEFAASIQGVAIRVTRLDALGNLLNGPGDSYTTSAFLRVSFTPEYEEGDEITEKSASGAICVSYKAPDTLKRITMELAICEPDPELTNLLSGGLLLSKNLGTFGAPNNTSIGWAAPAVGDDPSGNGVAIECWSLAIADGKKAAILPFFHWIFPFVKLRQSGDRVIENGLLANTFEGFGLGNAAFGDGLDGRWEFPVASDRPFAYARASYAPSRSLRGFYTWNGVLNASVTDQAVSSNVATLTTSASHEFAVGDPVTVSGVSTELNGPAVISAVTANTFSFARTTANVTSTAVSPTGVAVVPPGARQVNELPDGLLATTFNVPGNINHDETLASDYVIDSLSNPTL